MNETQQTPPQDIQDEQKTGLLSLAEKFSFFLPPEAAAKIPGLMLTMSIAAIALYTGAQLTYVTPLIVAMGIWYPATQCVYPPPRI